MVKKFIKAILLVVAVMVSVLIVIGSIIVYQNYSSVKSITIEAKLEYKKDSIQSLINYIHSPKHSLKERNRAVWALGQISDEKAISFLINLSEALTDSNGEELDHGNNLCRHEVDKALKSCKQKNFNLLRAIYSNREKW
jgi:HEAT repeat protein